MTVAQTPSTLSLAPFEVATLPASLQVPEFAPDCDVAKDMTVAEVSQRLAALQRDPGGAPVIVALIPAHNEQEGITKTVRSLLGQELQPNFVIVMADNCTDETVDRAVLAGAWVIKTIGNTAKKAGALNQGLSTIMPFLSDTDYVLCQDADG